MSARRAARRSPSQAAIACAVAASTSNSGAFGSASIRAPLDQVRVLFSHLARAVQPLRRGVMGNVTYYVAMGFERDETGDLVGTEPTECPSSAAAISRAGTISQTEIGAIAF